MTTEAASLSDSRLANLGARLVAEAYEGFESRFRIVTRRARIRFAERDWTGMAADARERLRLYEQASRRTSETVRELLGDRTEEQMVWTGMKAVYSGLIMDRHDWELAETFFNSVTRKIFSTVGVDPRMEFVDTDFDSPPTKSRAALHRTYPSMPIRELVRSVLTETALGAPFADLEADAERAAVRIDAHLRSIGALRVVEQAEMIDAVFFRGKGAYVIGRLYSGSHVVPLVLALLHPPEGIVVDAVLLTENRSRSSSRSHAPTSTSTSTVPGRWSNSSAPSCPVSGWPSSTSVSVTTSTARPPSTGSCAGTCSPWETGSRSPGAPGGW